jgi:hypothetical protein
MAFRRWKRPTVKTGGRLRTPMGELAIDAVERIETEAITDEDVRRAGFADRDALLASLRPEGDLYRIAFHVRGPDPRVALRERADLTGEEREEIARRLARMDASSTHGPWTADTLALIAERPATLAADLAAQMGRERLPFKADVRKLKELGLTESLEKGYRLSPRGRAFLEAATR